MALPPPDKNERDSDEQLPSWSTRIYRFFVGKPINLSDKRVFHQMSLVAVLAWVALGADGLSSSCYGPAESYLHLSGHNHLAVLLALLTVGTVVIIAQCYSYIIETFPNGGGGYVVASKLLGRHSGLVSGCSLLVDYILTITVSIAAAGDAIFGLIPGAHPDWKLWAELATVAVLILMNLRGVKESVTVLFPIFILFLVMHVLLIFGVFGLNIGQLAVVSEEVVTGFQTDLSSNGVGLWGMIGILLYAYSFGAGTYTGLEAVSNSTPILREPRIETARSTMRYMAVSLAFTAGGLLLGYLLLNVQQQGNHTLNGELATALVREVGIHGTWWGWLFVTLLLVSEGALLIIGAQTGFVDGPRVLANMANDGWVPDFFGHLSERLTIHYGIWVMGIFAFVALAYTKGQVSTLVMMYSINVFITFSLSMISMCTYWWKQRKANPLWKKRFALFFVGATITTSILAVTLIDKFDEGGYITVIVTAGLIILCSFIRHEYTRVEHLLYRLADDYTDMPVPEKPNPNPPDPEEPTAVVLVQHADLAAISLANVHRFVPGYFKNVIFLGVGIIDSGNFKGPGSLKELRNNLNTRVKHFCEFGSWLGFASTSYVSIGLDSVTEFERLANEVASKYPKATIFFTSYVFKRDRWYHPILHNRRSYFLQRRLQSSGLPIVSLPVVLD